MHNLQNIDENEVLRDVLSGLKDDVPPMPEELHAAWMQKVEEDMEDKRIEKVRNRKAFARFLSIAAAMVFIVGGTALTRDDLKLRTSLEAQYSRLKTSNDALAFGASTTDEYLLQLASYEEDEVADSAMTWSNSAMPAPKMAAGASNTSSYAMSRSTTDNAAPETGVSGAALTEANAAEKKVIRTASLTIQTQTYDASLTNLRALCEADGGWVESSSESTSSSTGLRTARLTLRVPQTGLDGYLTGAEQLGRITSRSESAVDVTASYQDTQARLETQIALMERLQALITESADLSDLLALESQIADTQYTIDALQSSLNSTDRQVTYATVSVTLREENAPAITDTSVSLGERILAAIRVGCGAVVGFLADMLVFVVAALPFIGIVAALIIVLVITRKIRRRKQK